MLEGETSRQPAQSAALDMSGALEVAAVKVAALQAYRRRRMRMVKRVGSCVTGLAVYFGFTSHGWAGCVWIGVWWLAVWGDGLAYVLSRAERDALRVIGGWEDVRAINPLLAGCCRGAPPLTRPTVLLLTRLLQRAQAGDLRVLTEGAREGLYLTLETWRPFPDVGWQETADYRIAAIRALAVLAEPDAAPILERLARGSSLGSDHGRVRDEALKCLALLRQRASQSEEARALLRPAAVGAAREDGLLRSTGASAVVGPDESLRSASGPAADNGRA
jgi:hypothetical protein